MIVEEMWRAGRWPMTTRGLRRMHIANAAVVGLFFWMFVPLQLLGLLLIDGDGRREMLGYLALCFGGGLAGVGTALGLHRRWGPQHRAEDALKARGARVTGTLLKKRYASSMPGNIPLCSYYLFGAEGPDGVPVFARMTARNGIPLGAPATIAYDPARPGAGVVVEKRSELGRRR